MLCGLQLYVLRFAFTFSFGSLMVLCAESGPKVEKIQVIIYDSAHNTNGLGKKIKYENPSHKTDWSN